MKVLKSWKAPIRFLLDLVVYIPGNKISFYSRIGTTLWGLIWFDVDFDSIISQPLTFKKWSGFSSCISCGWCETKVWDWFLVELQLCSTPKTFWVENFQRMFNSTHLIDIQSSLWIFLKLSGVTDGYDKWLLMVRIWCGFVSRIFLTNLNYLS